MATVKHIKIRSANYQAAIDYLTMQHDEFSNKPFLDPDGHMIPRTEYLLNGINCQAETFAEECQSVNHAFGKNNTREEVKAHHYIISFDPSDALENGLTLQKAEDIGMKIAKENFPGHQALVCAHPDGHNGSGNIHVHIVINSLRKFSVPQESYMTQNSDYLAGCKHRSTESFLKFLKQNVMTICQDEGLHQVDLLSPAKIRITEREYWAKRRGQKILDEETSSLKPMTFETEKDLLRHKISSILADSLTLEEFSGKLFSVYGISFHESRGKISYDVPDRERPIRGRQLGADFELDHITAVLSTRVTITHIDPSLRLVVDLQRNIKAMENPNYARKVKITNLQQMSRTLAFLQENKIGSLDELNGLYAMAESDADNIHSSLLKVESNLKKVNILIRNQGQYFANRSVYHQYLQADNKANFRSEHETELLLYEGARKVLRDEYGSHPFPSRKDLLSEKRTLQKERNRLYEEDAVARSRLRSIERIGQNVHTILEPVDQREQDREKNR